VPDSVTSAPACRETVFAAGHLGELTGQIPPELVDAVLADTQTTQRRLRALPSRVGVYFVLACCLFHGLGYRKVWAKLTAALPGRITPSNKAFRDLRRPLGAAPVKALFDVLAGPVAQPHTPGVRYDRYRTVAFDGCVSFKVPDTDRNRCWLGKLKAALGTTGYPVVKLMTLVETGTRAMLGAVFGPPRPAKPTTRESFSDCSTTTCWCCSTAASTPSGFSNRWPPPARSSWPGCATTAACPYSPGSTTARTWHVWAS
jgi:Insertion element 4 transposase N-terminal